MSGDIQPMQRLLGRPMAYVHPQRLRPAHGIDTPALRSAIDTMLDTPSAEMDAWQTLSPVARLWREHWRLLPAVASLIGAYLAKAELARGGRLMRLSRSEQAFARYALGSGINDICLDDSPLCEQLQALGLNSLLAFSERVPPLMCERLTWQFLPSVVARQRGLPATRPDLSLLILALQHARCSANPD